ncbi:GDI interacting protein 3 [Osmia lignaria lignaria]|uniref:UBX domain-containing protein 6 n=1 Tax=Osmia lignaria TaxID=473952 RepID=UPI0014781324|nr:UBX domain-containing protein 6 [Osmia lignaria]XP_034189041.1 UBX domain-containing protein 6 [Osmia lignaria]
MTEKIKSFFQKKKADVKFMNAGKGYKLTESTNIGTSTPIVAPRKRVEPSSEAKTAGQATLARLQAKETNTAKFNTSYAAIKAQVKKELEKEKEAQQKMQKSKAQPKEETEDTVKDSSQLAVSNVYFQCPYLSNEVLSQEDWKKKIREFLYEQLQEEEAGLTACLIIQNCNTGREKIESCVETLGKYLDNIIKNPEEEKYRKIRIHNRIFQDKVLPIEGAVEFLNAVGFWPKKLLHNDVEEDFLVWNPENCNLENVEKLADALKTAEIIPLELDRNLQVLLPTQASKRTELPPNFYSLTPEEIKREQQLRTEAVEKNQMLRTKAMRERDEKQRLRKYKYSLIRIKFPDDLILQGTFLVHEKFQNVVNFVSENLIKAERPFSLKKLAGPTFNQDSFDKTLLELELFPAALLVFFWQHTADTESAGYLKEELLGLIQSV